MRREQFEANFAKEQPANLGERVKEVIWFTGIDVARYDFWTDTEWTLRLPMAKARLERLNGGGPLLKDHTWSRSVDSQVGVFEKAWIENGVGMGRVKFADTPDVADLVRKIEDGIIQNLSMEATIDDLEDVTPRGSKGPKILQATGWEVEAVALVTVPADPSAKVMLSASPLPKFSSGPSAIDLMASAALSQVSEDTGAASEPEKQRVNPALLLAILRQQIA